MSTTGIMGRWKRWRSREGRCLHRSHRWQWRCRRDQAYDGFCREHNTTCFVSCDPELRARFYGPGPR